MTFRNDLQKHMGHTRPISEDEVLEAPDKEFSKMVPKLEKIFKAKGVPIAVIPTIFEIFAKCVDGASAKRLNVNNLSKVKSVLDKYYEYPESE